MRILRGDGRYDADAVSRGTVQRNRGDSRTVQSHREECDINTIVRRFGVTGMVPQTAAMPSYQTFDDVWDYQSAMNSVIAAQAAFMQIPSDVRERFRNDPQRFLEFCSDPKNLDELRKLGLAKPADITDTIPAPDVPATQEKGDVKGNVASRADKGSKPSKGSEGNSGGE